MELWIPVTIGAAFVQNLRFMLQKHLQATRLSAAGATFARSLFAAPLAGLVIAVRLVAGGSALPEMNAGFLIHGGIGAIAQLLATLCVVALFGARNFAVGITFKKTEVVLAAVAGYLILGEAVSGMGIFAILAGLAGVLLLSVTPTAAFGTGISQLLDRASLLGLGAGLLFAVSAVNFRGALLSLSGGDLFLRAVFSVLCVTAFQSLILGLWLGLRQPGEIGRVLRHWRVTGLVGLASILGTTGWFLAFSLQSAAYVKALGQIELVFSYLATRFVFRERSSPRELVAMGLIVLSILLLILAL